MKIRTTSDYCIDCGSPKAYADQFTLDYIADQINRRYRFSPGSNAVTFQVLVDASGFSSVISHNDNTNSGLTWDIIRLLNGVLWKAAKENGKKISSAVNVQFVINNSKITAKMQNVERDELAELEPAGDPKIYNKLYPYKNPNLGKYEFESWNRFDSMMPDNVCEALVVDKTDNLWVSTAKGLSRFDGTTFVNVNETNSPLKANAVVTTLATDKNNDTWFSADKNIYRYNHNGGWLLFDSTNFKIAGASHIIVNPSGDIFFTNVKGLQIVHNNDKIRLMDKQFLDVMPSEDVRYAYFDTKERLWIGTAKGSLMIDKKRKITLFNNTNTPLKNVVISGITEDDKGNLYFSLQAIDKTTDETDDEGLAIFNTANVWSHYNDKNSGMPSNRINSMLFDKTDHLLWMGTPESGLVRFDLKNGWENYNNHNCAMPSYNIGDLSQDSKGNIYAATSNGLLRVRKH